MATYATITDLREYAPELATRSDEELEAYLVSAQKDVDAYAGFFPIADTVNGVKFLLDDLETAVVLALNAATCAQARYRAYMGPVFFIEQQQYASVSGDVTTSRGSRFGPEMRSEFPVGYRKLTGRLR